MRLNSSLNSDRCQLDPNPIYIATEADIVELTSSLPVPEIDYAYEGKVVSYEVTPTVLNYYLKHYIPQSGYEAIKLDKDMYNDNRAIDLRFGPVEQEFVDILTRSRTVEHSQRALLVAKVGQGKTTLLAYIMKIVWTFHKELHNAIIPIVVNIHSIRNRLVEAHENKRSISDIINGTINLQLDPIVKRIAHVENNDFWRWYNTSVQTDLGSREDDLIATYGDDSRKMILEQRFLEKSHQEFSINAVQYVCSECHVKLVVALDNADPLPLPIIRDIGWYMEQYDGKPSTFFILSIRNTTLAKLRREYGFAISYPALTWKKASTRSLLMARFKTLQDDVIGGEKITINMFNRRLSGINKRDTLGSMIDLICHDDAVRYIDGLSNGNIRDKFKLARVILSSGHLPEELFGILLRSKVDHNVPFKKLHAYVVLKAIFTNGYETYFNRIMKSVDIPGTINLFDSARGVSSWRFFIRPMILSYLDRNGGASGVSYDRMKYHFDEVFEGHRDYNDIVHIFRSSILKLFNAGLLESPDMHDLRSIQDVTGNLEEISISDMGALFIDDLAYNIDYLMHIKDGIEMGDINVQEAKNIVECRKSSVTISGDVHRIDRRKLFSLNVQNTIHIFGEIAAKEASLLSEIKGRNRLSSWREYYSPIKGKTYGYAIISSIEDHINNHFAQDNLIRLCVSAKQHVDKLLSDEDIR